MHFSDSRRYAHIVLLVMLIVGIRACGGATQDEDRLTSVTRWTAERAGLSGAKNTLDTQVKPRMAQATGSMSSALYAASSQLMNSVEMAANNTVGWAWRQVVSAENEMEVRIRSTLSPNVPAQTERPDTVPQDNGRKTNPAH